MLSINAKCLKANVEAVDWKDSIRKAGQLLIDVGSVNKEYVESMIDIVKELGPYIVIAPHIALAHAKPCSNVMKDDISIITLNKPVNFNSDNDPVKVVICLAAVNGNSHISCLKDLACMLREDNCERLINCKTNEDLYKFVKES